MTDIYALTDNAILHQIGQKMKEERLAQNISQRKLAEMSGMSNFSISQMESGHNTSLLSLIMVLRALNRLDVLNELFQEPTISPMALSEAMRKQHQRQRAYPIVSTPQPIQKVADNSDFNWDD